MAKINWFPGHMAKSLKLLNANLAKCDYVIETCDSRLPASSRNPQLSKILANKKRMLLLTKSDLADPKETEKWLNYYSKLDDQLLTSSLAVDLFNNSDIKKIHSTIIKDNKHLIQKAKDRGRKIRPIRVMINGIPNTGKSTLINRLVGKKSTQVSNRPGVTRSIQWVRAATDFELMDTPGILHPSLETVAEQLNLAISGAIKDDVLPIIEVACGLIIILCQAYPRLMVNKYLLDLPSSLDYSNWAVPYEFLQDISYRLNLVKSGNKPDLERTARRLIRDYRQGKLGALSLEFIDQTIIYPKSI